MLVFGMKLKNTFISTEIQYTMYEIRSITSIKYELYNRIITSVYFIFYALSWPYTDVNVRCIITACFLLLLGL